VSAPRSATWEALADGVVDALIRAARADPAPARATESEVDRPAVAEGRYRRRAMSLGLGEKPWCNGHGIRWPTSRSMRLGYLDFRPSPTSTGEGSIPIRASERKARRRPSLSTPAAHLSRFPWDARFAPLARRGPGECLQLTFGDARGRSGAEPTNLPFRVGARAIARPIAVHPRPPLPAKSGRSGRSGPWQNVPAPAQQFAARGPAC